MLNIFIVRQTKKRSLMIKMRCPKIVLLSPWYYNLSNRPSKHLAVAGQCLEIWRPKAKNVVLRRRVGVMLKSYSFPF